MGDNSAAHSSFRKSLKILNAISDETLSYKEQEALANLEFTDMLFAEGRLSQEFEQSCLIAAIYYENVVKYTETTEENLSNIYQNLIRYYT